VNRGSGRSKSLAKKTCQDSRMACPKKARRFLQVALSTDGVRIAINAPDRIPSHHHEVSSCCHNDCRSHRGRCKVVTGAFPILRIIVAGRLGDRACRLKCRRAARAAIQRTNRATGRRDSRFAARGATSEPFVGALFLIRRPPGANRYIKRQADASLCHRCLVLISSRQVTVTARYCPGPLGRFFCTVPFFSPEANNRPGFG